MTKEPENQITPQNMQNNCFKYIFSDTMFWPGFQH